MKKKRIKLAGRNSFRVISVGFMILILTGALLLMLPIASQSRTVTPFKDTLFTAISASCVTGLVVKDNCNTLIIIRAGSNTDTYSDRRNGSYNHRSYNNKTFRQKNRFRLSRNDAGFYFSTTGRRNAEAHKVYT